jgi:bacillolysin/thermolysin
MGNWRRLLAVTAFVLILFTGGYALDKADLSSVEHFEPGEHMTPIVMRGVLARPTKTEADPVRVFLSSFDNVFRVENLIENVQETRVVLDESGIRHIRMQQTYEGLPVHGAEFYLQVEGDEVIGFTGNLLPAVRVNTVPSLSEASAVQAAVKTAPGPVEKSLDPELLVYPVDKEQYVLAYKTVSLGRDMAYVAFVDAHTGKILHSYNDIHNEARNMNSYYEGYVTVYTTTQDGTTYMYDTETGADYIRVMTANNGTSLPGSYVTLNSGTTTLSKATQMLYALERSYLFFYNNFNYRSYDNADAPLTATIEYSRNYANAYWSPYQSQFVFGDGDGSTMRYLGAIDVVAHEFSHAFCSSTANLQYSYESGAINEANSDIFGSQIDPDQDWQMGEDVMIGSVPLRDIANPQNSYGYPLPRYYAERYTGSDDNGGVHINMSIGSKFFQLLVDGGNWYNGSATISVSGIGRTKALNIWYRCMTTKFTTTTNYAQARAYSIAAAQELYGSSSNEANQVMNAWAAVGVGEPAGGGGGGTTDDTYEPNDTTAQAYAVSAGRSYDSYIYTSSDKDYYKFTATSDGTLNLTLGNLPKDYDMFLYNSSGTELARAYTSNNPETISKTITAGTYYILVNGYNGAYSTTSAYRLTVAFTASGGGGGTTDPYEPNDTMTQAYSVTAGNTYQSYIYTASDKDYYKLALSEAGTLTLTLGNLPKDYDMFLYNSSGTEVARAYTSNNPEKITYEASAGTYYIMVNGYNGAYSTATMYSLAIAFAGSGGGGGGEAQWYVETLSTPAETPHNYPNNWTNSIYYQKTGAQQVAVHFSTFNFETNYDKVYILDKNGTQKAVYTGVKSAFWAIVDGDKITVKTVTDYSVTKYGYVIDQVAYFSEGPLSLAALPAQEEITAAESVNFVPGAPIKAKGVENYPNPFNPETDIYFQVPSSGKVTVQVFDRNGRMVKELVNENLGAGQHQRHWDGRDERGNELPSGIYYCVVRGEEGFKSFRKMIMLK